MLSESPLQIARRQQRPTLPPIFHDLSTVSVIPSQQTYVIPADVAALFPHTVGQQKLTFISRQQDKKRHPKRVGVVLSGGQAPGGHNVIIGLFDALKKLHSDSKLFGFLKGPGGIIKGHYRELLEEELSGYLNTGGFDLIGSGRTKIETAEQLAAATKVVEELRLDGLVIIGGDDSNTNAAILAEYFRSVGCPCNVVGAPKTIDGDLRSEDVEVSFGFDTACKTYSDIIGNICRDALSAKKYYHFIRLMGRSASHVTLECALQTHPNVTLISEEVAERSWSLSHITAYIADVICQRSSNGKNYGVILVPEGLIEYVPDCRQLIKELNARNESLSPVAAACMKAIPKEIQTQLLLDRDPHGNIQVSKIETERLLIAMVAEELRRRDSYHGDFNPQPHFLGYEGRACFPSLFDSNYCYTLGYICALLIDASATGYVAFVKNLNSPCEEWEAGGAPLTQLFHLEERHGVRMPVIRKALVRLDSPVFASFATQRDSWASEDHYRYPGPIQFWAP